MKKQFRVYRKQNSNTLSDNFISGGIAGIANSIISSPMEHIRIRMQTQKTVKIYNGSVDCARQILAKHGIQGLYKGFLITIYREFFLYAAYFLAYAKVKSLQENPSKSWLMVSGGVAGISGWMGGCLLDNIKSRIQSDSFVDPKYPSLWKIPH